MQTAQIIHAYKQAPWRVQRQWIGVFLLAVIGAAMVAALYLDVTARAALAGRQIQEARLEITTIQRENADLETQLADLTSTSVMEQRAKALGYRPVLPGELDYVAVPGFCGARTGDPTGRGRHHTHRTSPTSRIYPIPARVAG